MYELGKKDKIFGADLLRPLKPFSDIWVDSRGRPEAMPVLRERASVIASFDQGLGERMIVCESLEDMQRLWDQYAQGLALTLDWYAGDDPGFITILSGSEGPAPT